MVSGASQYEHLQVITFGCFDAKYFSMFVLIFILMIRQLRAFCWVFFSKWFSRVPKNKNEQKRQLLRRFGYSICYLEGMVSAVSVPSSLNFAGLNVLSGPRLSFFLLVVVVVSILVCCVV